MDMKMVVQSMLAILAFIAVIVLVVAFLCIAAPWMVGTGERLYYEARGIPKEPPSPHCIPSSLN